MTDTARKHIEDGLDTMGGIVGDAMEDGLLSEKEALFITSAAALASLIGGALLDVADAIREQATS